MTTNTTTGQHKPTRLNTAAASAYLDVPVATLRWFRHMRDRGPRSYKIGRHVFYDVADLDAWLASEAAASQRGAPLAGSQTP